jgi:hypothetical protein
MCLNMPKQKLVLEISDFMYEQLKKNLLYPEDELDFRLNEFLKYIYLCSKYGGGFIPLKKEVDEIWHEFILQTKEYFDLCDRLPGKRYIHHKSGNLEEYIEGKDKRNVVKKLIEWIPLYNKHFGNMTLEQAQLWTIPSFLINELGMTIDAVNSVGRQTEHTSH